MVGVRKPVSIRVGVRAGTFFVAVALLAALAGSWCQAQAPATVVAEELKKGDAVPDFAATALDGKPFKLSDHKGKVVLLDFWATWCGPCIVELPNVQAVYKRYHEKGLEIIGISLDVDRERLERFLKDREIPWTQVFDGKGWESEIGDQYGVKSIPRAILLDRELKVFSADARGGELVMAVAELAGDREAVEKARVASRALQAALSGTDGEASARLAEEYLSTGFAGGDELNALAWSSLERGGPHAKAALAMARGADALSPDNDAIIDTLAWAELRNGLNDEAIGHFKKAIELGGDVAFESLGLALAYAAKGDSDNGWDALAVSAEEASSAPEWRVAEAVTALSKLPEPKDGAKKAKLLAMWDTWEKTGVLVLKAGGEGDAISLAKTTPVSPGQLKAGEEMELSIEYKLASEEEARIRVIPQSDGGMVQTTRPLTFTRGSGTQSMRARSLRPDRLRGVLLLMETRKGPLMKVAVRTDVEWK